MAKSGKSKKNTIIGCIITIIVLALIAVGVFFTVKTIKANSLKKLIGNYDLISMEENGEVTTEEDIQTLKKWGFTVTMELREDKTGKLDLFGDVEEFSYDKDKLTTEKEEIPYTFEDNQFTMEQDGTKLVFKKIVEE